MAGFAQEFITLTPLNCVKECRALIQTPKQRNYLTTAALFGLYCGVLLYRAYKKYLIEMKNKMEIIEMQAQEMQSENSYVLDPPPVTSKELLLPPIIDQAEINAGSFESAPRSEIEPFITSHPLLNTST
ncbi:hypothetical protein KR215_000306 [Drosophila sulfurigaster]|uniref:Uncharacterized protein LOC117573182 n=1 Tax=Drosophila albomicans TaxID=7291 RepID=A0A6P8X766_DROAB|nr:uncharacterized protein LOC117573182 [Drosophila albomicans]XP_060663848.1 uncharacterized protein LOC132796622 [Drosophila nasuta]XP_062140444.1 uncharacterized protein LOC133848768 [Drosophila sulfurigaster albostrigata]KAH8399702.1 hypothetical protein KR215_000306 [Drosophila sulfurigaster]